MDCESACGGDGRPKIVLMAILLPPLSGTSEVRNQFLAPLRAVYHQATTIRNCPAESDWDWLSKGVDRVLSNVRSGRDFLQTFQRFWRREVQVGPYFETLSSDRRLGMVAECSGWLRRRVDAGRQSLLSTFESLASFDLYAGDGHYLEQATQDPMMGETRWPTGHFFALNLKSQSLFPLVLADLVGGKEGVRCPGAQAAERGDVAPGSRERAQGDVGLGQGGGGSALLAGSQGVGDLLPVPPQSGNVPGS